MVWFYCMRRSNLTHATSSLQRAHLQHHWSPHQQRQRYHQFHEFQSFGGTSTNLGIALRYPHSDDAGSGIPVASVHNS